MMATIYGCATLTIIATTEKTRIQDCQGISAPRRHYLAEEIDGHTLFTVPHHISEDRQQFSWSTRAWTLQEELLSTRMLQFTESQIQFNCPRTVVSESTDVGSSFPDYLPDHPALSSIESFTRIHSVSLCAGSLPCCIR